MMWNILTLGILTYYRSFGLAFGIGILLNLKFNSVRLFQKV